MIASWNHGELLNKNTPIPSRIPPSHQEYPHPIKNTPIPSRIPPSHPIKNISIPSNIMINVAQHASMGLLHLHEQRYYEPVWSFSSMRSLRHGKSVKMHSQLLKRRRRRQLFVNVPSFSCFSLKWAHFRQKWLVHLPTSLLVCFRKIIR